MTSERDDSTSTRLVSKASFSLSTITPRSPSVARIEGNITKRHKSIFYRSVIKSKLSFVIFTFEENLRVVGGTRRKFYFLRNEIGTKASDGT